MALLCALTAVVTLALNWGSLSLSRQPGGVASLWPGDAVVLCLMRLRDGRYAWTRFAAGALGAVTASRLWHDSWPVAFDLAAANCLGIALVYVGVRMQGTLDLQRTTAVLRFLAIALVASMISGLAGIATLQALEKIDIVNTWARWVLGDWLGYAALAPPLMILTSARRAEAAWRVNPREAALVLIGYTILVSGVFAEIRYPMLFLIPLALFAVAYLAELDGVMIAILISIVSGTILNTIHRGPGAIVGGDANQRLVVMQIFLALMTLTFLPISAIMTERRRLEAQVREARAAAEAASALKSEFLADISHELRTPLASILGFAGILRSNAHLGADERAYAESISVAGSALLTTVNDMLAFSELEARKLDIETASASLARIAAEAVGLFQAGAAAKGLGLSFVVDEAAPEAVMVDRGRVRQVLLNLLANAVKFTETGSVTVLVGYDPAIQAARLSVRDTGPGLEADQIPLLFDRFSRADAGMRRRHGGTGLGLAICKGLVEAMGGAIDVHSVLGQGTTLSFWIPAPAAPRPEPVVADIAGALRPRTRRLLMAGAIVDPGWAKTLLEPLQLEIAYVEDAATAQALVRDRSFDLVLIDADWPGLNGPGLIAALRGSQSASRAALTLCVCQDPEGRSSLMGAGADGCLGKPVSSNTLIGLVISAPREAAAPPAA